jgi:hypothetical protein
MNKYEELKKQLYEEEIKLYQQFEENHKAGDFVHYGSQLYLVASSKNIRTIRKYVLFPVVVETNWKHTAQIVDLTPAIISGLVDVAKTDVGNFIYTQTLAQIEEDESVPF